jgi:hypothetical protein
MNNLILTQESQPLDSKKQKFINFSRNCLMAVFFMLPFFAVTAFASSSGSLDSGSTAGFDEVIKYIAGWIARMSGVVLMFGVFSLGFSVKSNDPNGKQDALLWIASSFIVGGAALAYTFFTNVFSI